MSNDSLGSEGSGWSDDDFQQVVNVTSEELENNDLAIEEKKQVAVVENNDGDDGEEKEKNDEAASGLNAVLGTPIVKGIENDFITAYLSPSTIGMLNSIGGMVTNDSIGSGGSNKQLFPFSSPNSILGDDTSGVRLDIGNMSNTPMSTIPTNGNKSDNNKNEGTDPNELVFESLDGPTFEQIMKERAKVRREKEEYYIAELRVKMTRLEQALVGETKRRFDALAKLEKSTKTEISNMEKKVMEQIQKEHEWLENRFDSIDSRIDDLSEKWQGDAQNQNDDIATKSDNINTILDELRTNVETERKSRLIREGRLLQQIDNHSKIIQEQLSSECNERNNVVEELKYQVQIRENDRNAHQKSFESRLTNELTKLQKEMNLETYERQSQDQAIAAALNRYTQQFQQSLSILTEN